MKIEKARRKCTCYMCRKPIESKDWRALLNSSERIYYHLQCLLKYAERRKKEYGNIAREIKKHRHILAKEKEKFILRSI